MKKESFGLAVPESKFINQKFINDLKKGFKITEAEQISNSSSTTLEVITRVGDDLFFVQTNFVSDPTVFYGDGYGRFYCEVRRRKALPGEKNAATLEVWTLHRATLSNQNEESFKVQFKNGGKLDEEEFWIRYNASVVDEEATRKFLEIRKQEKAKVYAKCKTWKITFEENPDQEKLVSELTPDFNE
jgi:hypothetical protein